MNVKEYVDLYCDIIEEVKERLPKNSSELKRQIAQDVFFVICKDRRTDRIQPNYNNHDHDKEEPKEYRKNGARLSTPGQRQALYKFGIKEFDKGTLSYEDASHMLDQLIDAAEFDKKHHIKKGDKGSKVEAVRQKINEELEIDKEIEEFGEEEL